MNEPFWLRANAVLGELQNTAGLSDARALAWFGIEHPDLGGVPAALLVDEDRLADVIAAARKAGAP